ncbi:Hypothetical predicted protein, partial [Pelobates cultripes]
RVSPPMSAFSSGIQFVLLSGLKMVSIPASSPIRQSLVRNTRKSAVPTCGYDRCYVTSGLYCHNVISGFT